LGRAGHARALLEACPGLFLIGIDADVAAIEAAGELLAPYAERVTLVHARYDEIPAILGPAQAMGLLFDLGVSSPQLDDPERGFAYAQDAPLDMRMDRTAERTAADVVNGYPPAELSASCTSTARSGSPGGSPRRWSVSAPAPRSPRLSG
jgi:16S rRNA (cytosine1402-N4)-methyltransferase